VIFSLLPNNTFQWRFRFQQRTLKVAANNSSHCTFAARPFQSQQRQAPERACITFSRISNHIYDQLIKMYFFPLVSCTTILTCGCYKVITTCSVIFTFFCNNNSRSVTFQHPRADDCRMLSPRASKILRCFFGQRKFCVAFSCEKKFCVFFRCTMCIIIFFRSSASATKISMKVLNIETKVLYVLVKSKPNRVI